MIFIITKILQDELDRMGYFYNRYWIKVIYIQSIFVERYYISLNRYHHIKCAFSKINDAVIFCTYNISMKWKDLTLYGLLFFFGKLIFRYKYMCTIQLKCSLLMYVVSYLIPFFNENFKNVLGTHFLYVFAILKVISKCAFYNYFKIFVIKIKLTYCVTKGHIGGTPWPNAKCAVMNFSFGI